MNKNGGKSDLAGKRVALYIRVSSYKQKVKGLSLDEQQYELELYAKQQKAIVVGTYRDEGTSANKNLQRRHELQRLLQDVKADRIDVILFTNLDRWLTCRTSSFPLFLVKIACLCGCANVVAIIVLRNLSINAL